MEPNRIHPRTSLAACLLGSALALGPVAGAQQATSPFFELKDLVLDGGGGGLASPGFAAFVALEPNDGTELASPGFQAAVGFLAAHDPMPTNAPLVFGVTPALGAKEGGTAVTVSGLNFDQLGSGASIAIGFDGFPAAAVTVDSNTQLSVVTPAAPMGPADVEVTSLYGAGTLGAGFVFTPAVVSSPTAQVGGPLEIRNYGPPGGTFQTHVAFTETFVTLPGLGDLLIGPSTFPVLTASYPGTDGVHVAQLQVPDLPSLVDVTAYFQSMSIETLVPLAGTLTNSTSTLLQ